MTPSRLLFAAILALTFVPFARGAEPAATAKPPVYLWLEPEWFPDVQGSFNYWTGTDKARGAWGMAGPGISAEFSQGGESEWQSIGATADETNAACSRAITVPRAGKYKLWVRYFDHREKTEPFTVKLEQNGQPIIAGELGATPVVPPNDEYMLYWDFAFGWAALEGQLAEGPATLRLVIDKPGQAWRQVDAILLTDDLAYEPVAREKPPFAYMESFGLRPQDAGAKWRGSGEGMAGGANVAKRVPIADRDFSMWASIHDQGKWWAGQTPAAVDALTTHDLMFQFGPPADLRETFAKQFAGRRDLPVLSWPHLLPGVYLATPDLSPGTPLRAWLERTKTPFFILTNYANPAYDDKTGPATYQALAGPLAGQFMGFIHGEAVGTGGVGFPQQHAPGATRRQHVDALATHFRAEQAKQWSAIFKTNVPESFREKSISCLSVQATAMPHLFAHAGQKTLGYEIDATNSHAPMRVAFHRGAARQYGAAWINYASGNFGDACNYFTQDPIVPRGAKGWWHSKYAITDGVPIAWYRQLYYLNYLSGASAVFWEQGLSNQWMKPGPGEHPIQLSPFGRATADFQGFVDRVGDRGEPYTPVAFLLSYGHGYEPVNYDCRALHAYPESEADRELRELFNVAWHPAEVMAAEPITPELQSMPGGAFGNIFDVLVDRPEKIAAVNDYPIVWAAGDVELGGNVAAALQDYVANRGGTLVVNVEAARGKLPESLLGVTLTGRRETFDAWTPWGEATRATPPYEAEVAEPAAAARVLAWAGPNVPLVTRHAVGKGAVILTLVPRTVAKDERAHPALPWLMNGLTEDLLPVQVRLADGSPPRGEVMYQLNRTKTGWLVLLVNNHGVDKTQNGIARVDRRAFKDVALHTPLAVKSVRELTQPRDVAAEKAGAGVVVRLRVQPGDVQVVELVTD